MVVAGNIEDKQGILDLIQEKFADLSNATSLIKTPYQPYKPEESSSTLMQWVNQAHVVMFAQGIGLKDEKMVCAAKLLANILWGSTSSRLKLEIREGLGLCYYVGAGHSATPDGWDFQIMAWLDKKKLQMGLDAIYKVVEDIANWNITQEEFDLAKSNYLGLIQMGLETSDAVADWVWYRYIMRKDIQTLEQVMEQYRQVSFEDVLALCSLLKRANLYTYWIE